MKKVLVCLLLFLCHTSHAQSVTNLIIPSPLGVVVTVGQWLWNLPEPVYEVTVASTAPTQEQALRQGWALAVEQALGTLVLTTAQSESGRLTQDTIATHASGYVDRYEIIKQQGTTITQRVWVRKNVINLARLTRSSAEAFVAPAQTWQHQQVTGDRVLADVLQAFPAHSFNIETQSVSWRVLPNRQQALEVKYTVTWSEAWLAAWREAQKQTRTEPGRWDPVRQNLVLDYLVDSRPQIQLTVLDDQGRVVFRACKAYSELDHQVVQQWGPRFVTWAPGTVTTHNSKISGHLSVRVPLGQEASYNQVKLQVIPFKQCE